MVVGQAMNDDIVVTIIWVLAVVVATVVVFLLVKT